MDTMTKPIDGLSQFVNENPLKYLNYDDEESVLNAVKKRHMAFVKAITSSLQNFEEEGNLAKIKTLNALPELLDCILQLAHKCLARAFPRLRGACQPVVRRGTWQRQERRQPIGAGVRHDRPP